MIVVRFKHGLGNQMFQYSLMCSVHKINQCNVCADTSFYNTNKFRNLTIKEAFPKIQLCTGGIFTNLLYKLINRNGFSGRVVRKLTHIFMKYVPEKHGFRYDEKILKGNHRYYDGYWQTEKYFLDDRNTIISSFEFAPIHNHYVNTVSEQISCCNAVSIHIRGTDYIKRKKYQVVDESYYQKAIEYIKNKVDNPVFYVFTDDIEYAKKLLNGIDCEFKMIQKGTEIYPDWCDMMLMSKCKHNIIPNSTFAWWGAYLNQNAHKIVIAPKKWLNTCDAVDICPDHWVRI